MTQPEAAYTYPQYEKIFADGQAEAFLKRVEQTCRQLELAAAGGTGSEKDRAVAALGAYRRSLALLQEIGETRSKMATPGQSHR